MDEKKVVLLGNSGVGKTSIVLRLSECAFRPMTEPTIGSGVISKVIETNSGSVTLNIWDTAGEERYRSFTGLYSKGAAACIIVFDVTDMESFNTLDEWVLTFRENAEEKAKIFIVGNKNDLVESRQVKFDASFKWAQDHGFTYQEVSAKTGENVDILFNEVANSLNDMANEIDDIEFRAVSKEKGCC